MKLLEMPDRRPSLVVADDDLVFYLEAQALIANTATVVEAFEVWDLLKAHAQLTTALVNEAAARVDQLSEAKQS